MDRTPRAWAARLGVTATAALTVGAAALPAHADDTLPPSVSVSLNQAVTIGGPGSPGKDVSAQVDANRVTGVKVSFDVSGLAGVATVTFPKNCTAAGQTETCTFADSAEIHEAMPLVLTPAAGAKAGDSGTILYTGSADGIPGYTFTSTVTVADGVDLVMLSGNTGGKPVPAKLHAKVGVPVEFMNAGNQPTDGLQITLRLDHGLVPDTYTNCTYGEDHAEHVVVCAFDDPVEDAMAPGDVMQMDDFGVTVAGDALGFEGVDFRVDGLTAGSAARAAVRMSPRTGGKTLHVNRIVRPRALAKTADIDDGDNWGFVDWDVANSLDLAAFGATASGKVGDVVPVTVGLKNNGPAALDSTRAGEPALAIGFEVPPGTQVTSVPSSCAAVTEENGSVREQPGQAGGAYYRCRSGEFVAVGATISATFKLKITKVIPGATGTVGLTSPWVATPQWLHDDNPANDQAPVVINPATGGTGGGTGSTTGNLPITGAQTGLLVAGGVVLLGGGGAMYLLARRRRVVLVADGNDGAS